MRPVPVLMYHHVSPHKKDMVTVTPEVFEKQMEHLYKSGYKTLTLDELLSYINGDLIPEQKAVVVTFDDGWLDNYIYAFPVIEKYKIHAAIFIITGSTEKASENPTQLPSHTPTHKESKLLIKKGEGQKVLLNWELIKKCRLQAWLIFIHIQKAIKNAACYQRLNCWKNLANPNRPLKKTRQGLPLPLLAVRRL